MDQVLPLIGRRGIDLISRTGGLSLLAIRFLSDLPFCFRRRRQLIEQCFSIGVRSLPLIVVISLFVGAVSAWQAAYQFQFIGAPLRFLGQAVGKAVVIELAPVLSALVIAGRVGAGIASEIATMRVTEQIDALEAMGIDPHQYLILPRIMASLFMLPLLVIFAIFIAIIGGLAVAVIGVDVAAETYMNGFRTSFQLGDLINGLIKALVFGGVIGLVGCFEGYRASGGAEGVGTATTSSVVISSVLILILNFLFAVLLFRF